MSLSQRTPCRFAHGDQMRLMCAPESQRGLTVHVEDATVFERSPIGNEVPFASDLHVHVGDRDGVDEADDIDGRDLRIAVDPRIAADLRIAADPRIAVDPRIAADPRIAVDLRITAGLRQCVGLR